jgi:protein farnesyltransferase subunit beta
MFAGADALQEYILIAAQHENGGLLDKPDKCVGVAVLSTRAFTLNVAPRRPDAYHTCYNLSGLSAAQHQLVHSPALADALREGFVRPTELEVIKGVNESDEAAYERMAATYAHAVAWREVAEAKRVVGVKENEVVREWLLAYRTSPTCAQIVTHPVFNVTTSRATVMLNHFYEQPEMVSSSSWLT